MVALPVSAACKLVELLRLDRRRRGWRINFIIHANAITAPKTRAAAIAPIMITSNETSSLSLRRISCQKDCKPVSPRGETGTVRTDVVVVVAVPVVLLLLAGVVGSSCGAVVVARVRLRFDVETAFVAVVGCAEVTEAVLIEVVIVEVVVVVDVVVVVVVVVWGG